MSREDFSSFLRRATTVESPLLCPELRLYTAPDLASLWQEQEELLGRRGLAAPFWSIAWPGGQGLARYILDNPTLIAGRAVLDFGSGSGICAIAAAMAGARLVDAADIDACSRHAIAANAALNEVRVDCLAEDVIGEPSRWDIVLAGDVWYERFLADRATAWLRQVAATGATVLLGDLGRAHFPRARLVELGRYAVRAPKFLEREAVSVTGVWKFLASQGPEAHKL